MACRSNVVTRARTTARQHLHEVFGSSGAKTITGTVSRSRGESHVRKLMRSRRRWSSAVISRRTGSLAPSDLAPRPRQYGAFSALRDRQDQTTRYCSASLRRLPSVQPNAYRLCVIWHKIGSARLCIGGYIEGPRHPPQVVVLGRRGIRNAETPDAITLCQSKLDVLQRGGGRTLVRAGLTSQTARAAHAVLAAVTERPPLDNRGRAALKYKPPMDLEIRGRARCRCPRLWKRQNHNHKHRDEQRGGSRHASAHGRQHPRGKASGPVRLRRRVLHSSIITCVPSPAWSDGIEAAHRGSCGASLN